MRKKALSMLLAAILLLSLAACASGSGRPAGQGTPEPAPTAAEPTPAPEEPPEPTPAPAEPAEPTPAPAEPAETAPTPAPAQTPLPTEAPETEEAPAATLAQRLSGRWAARIGGEGEETEWYTLELVEFCGNLYAQAGTAFFREGDESLEDYSFCALELVPAQPSRLLDPEGESCEFAYLAFSVMSNLSRWWGPPRPCTLTLTEEGLLFTGDGGLPLLSADSLLLARDERVAAAFPYAETLPLEPGETPPEELRGLWMEEESDLPLFLDVGPGEAPDTLLLRCYEKTPGAEVKLSIGGGVWQAGTLTALTSSLGSGTAPLWWEAEVSLEGDALRLTSLSEEPFGREGELLFRRVPDSQVPLMALEEEAIPGRSVFVEPGPDMRAAEAMAAYRELLARLRLSWEEQWDEEKMMEEFGYTGFVECGWPGWAEQEDELGFLLYELNGDWVPELILSYLNRPADIYSFDGSAPVHSFSRGLSETMTLYQDGMIFSEAGGGGELWETWYRISGVSGMAIPLAEHVLTVTPEEERDEWYLYCGATDLETAEEDYLEYGQYPVWIWEWADMVDEETYLAYASQAPELILPDAAPLSEGEFLYWPG